VDLIRKRQTTAYFKSKLRERQWKIEGLSGEAKQNHGLRSKIQRETKSSNTSVPDRNGPEPHEASNLFAILAFYFSKTGFSTGP